MTPRWLKLKDAATYSAIGKQRLISLARDGQVRGFQDPDSQRGDWIFDRLSIDVYSERQFAQSDKLDKEALDIWNDLSIDVYRERQFAQSDKLDKEALDIWNDLTKRSKNATVQKK